MLSGKTLSPVEGLALSFFPAFLSVVWVTFSRIEEGIGEKEFLFCGVGPDYPLFGANESSFCKFGLEVVELMEKDLIDFSPFSSGVQEL